MNNISTSSGQAKKVLIVDDDEFLLDMYVVKFKAAGFELEIAEDGEAAVEKAKKFNPDVILLDIVMPKLDGFGVLRALKQEKIAPNALIFVLSNLGQKEDTDRGIGLGAVDYIVKAHFTPSEIVTKVRATLKAKYF